MVGRMDPWSQQVEVEDYGRLIKEFGIEPFRPLRKRLKEPDRD